MSFSVTCNFIIVTPGKKYIVTFFFQVSLKYFFKKNATICSSHNKGVMFMIYIYIYIIYMYIYIHIYIYILSNKRFRDHTLSMYKGVQRIFVGVVKYFRHTLTGHEKFFKIFDGSQNVFLCSIFVISFFSLKGLEHKISKLAIKEI